ncbi:MAG: ABC transporter permease, partial [Candidatus Rokubacteria bacterium RIFCSPLOWO2_12_FULL_69_21]
AAVLAPWLTPHDPNRQDLSAIRQPPVWMGGAWDHPLGTDSLGRDLLSRLLWSARVAVMVALGATVCAAVIGTPVGLVSGYFRGRLDTVLMRVVDVWMSIPAVLLAIALMAVLGVGLLKVILAIVLVDWTRFARVIRGEVLALREREFVEASRAIGLGPFRIMAEELLPNLVPLLIVLASLEMAIAVGVEALLSFVGLGVEAAVPSWGSMIAEGRGYLLVGWWGMTLPMLALVVTVVGFNLLGEGLREQLDPRLRTEAAR